MSGAVVVAAMDGSICLGGGGRVDQVDLLNGLLLLGNVMSGRDPAAQQRGRRRS